MEDEAGLLAHCIRYLQTSLECKEYGKNILNKFLFSWCYCFFFDLKDVYNAKMLITLLFIIYLWSKLCRMFGILKKEKGKNSYLLADYFQTLKVLLFVKLTFKQIKT